MKLLIYGFMVVLAVSFAGCGKKEVPSHQVEEETEAEEQLELPELSQNQYRGKRFVPDPAADAFQPMPSDLPEIPQEELELAGPPVD